MEYAKCSGRGEGGQKHAPQKRNDFDVDTLGCGKSSTVKIWRGKAGGLVVLIVSQGKRLEGYSLSLAEIENVEEVSDKEILQNPSRGKRLALGLVDLEL